MRKLLYALAVSLLAFIPFSTPSFAQNAGAVAADFYSQAPTITHKGTQYSTGELTFNATPPASSVITLMAWTWAFDSATPSGTIVNLCYGNGINPDCFNISELPTGSTTHFANYPAQGAYFYITFKVPGSGTIAPLYPKSTDQVILNYQY